MTLDTLSEPKSVVLVVGASATPRKPGHDVIKNILANGYGGRLYLVNPKGGEILGIPVNRSIQEVPDGVDQAIIILPAKDNLKTMRECYEKGIKTFVLAAGGFSEVDEEGNLLQDEWIRFIQETGVRVIGPNTSGHTSTHHHFWNPGEFRPAPGSRSHSRFCPFWPGAGRIWKGAGFDRILSANGIPVVAEERKTQDVIPLEMAEGKPRSSPWPPARPLGALPSCRRKAGNLCPVIFF